MRRWFHFSNLLFVAALAGLFLAARLQLPAEPGAAPAEVSVNALELARHAEAADCWMAINGEVYDLTDYLPEHPSRPAVILAWCGREASEAYRTKGKGKPHSAAAGQLLPAYRIGRYQAD